MKLAMLINRAGNLATRLLPRIHTYGNYAENFNVQKSYSIENLVLVRHAGHSHWQNIRHIKGAKDAQKAGLAAQAAYRIRSSIRESGNSNVKTNTALAKAVEFAEQNNVSTKAIESMIAKALASKDRYSKTTKIETQGPSGSLIVFEVATESPRKATKDINRVFNKYGWSVLSAGASTGSFTDKGIIIASPKDSKNLTIAEAEDIAITAEAEEVSLMDGNMFRLVCDPDTLYAVVKELSGTDLDVLDSKVEPVPVIALEITDKEKKDVEEAVQAVRQLSEHTVDTIYDNIEW